MNGNHINENNAAATIAAFQQLSRTDSDDLTAAAAASDRPFHSQNSSKLASSRQFASFIGLGIDSVFESEKYDATVAAVKAVSDALDRNLGTLRILQQGCGHGALHAHLILGIPGNSSISESGVEGLLTVDLTRVKQLFPSSLVVDAVEIVHGGLAVRDENLCTSTALLRVYYTAPSEPITETIMPPLTWEQVEQDSGESPANKAPRQERSVSICRASPHVHRSTSIELLARISSQIHESELPATKDEEKTVYKKLPPIAITSEKQTKRLLVRHDYKDYSQEIPLHGELDHVITDADSTTGSFSTSNWAFPLKLHETLQQIEAEGNSDIIGWLPHGRSFKIFKQKEFVEVVLPRYFVMTKKSSFLRQLNLYGFKRLCRFGSDQGSYYHPLFLRGLKFLAKRMQREKVNGNGIRTAGNPGEEPILSEFPPLPNNPHNAQDVLRTSPKPLSSTPPKANLPRQKSSTADPILLNPDGVHATFPVRLQRILDKLEADGDSDVLTWLPHGRAFIVRDTTRFVQELMPVYFNQSKYSSFQRQLHMYGFARITSNGPDKGAYHNPNFVRGQPGLAFTMRRTRVNGKGTRKPGDPESEPDFYKLDPLPSVPQGTRVAVPLERLRRSQGDQSVDENEDSESTGSVFDI